MDEKRFAVKFAKKEPGYVGWGIREKFVVGLENMSSSVVLTTVELLSSILTMSELFTFYCCSVSTTSPLCCVWRGEDEGKAVKLRGAVITQGTSCCFTGEQLYT